jgi:uncharacterized protein YjiS (DUF1127 family)
MPFISSHPTHVTHAPHRGSLAMRALRAFVRMTHLSAQRRALSHLDLYLLNDIGVSPEEARREAARPVWDAPSHWQG